MSPLASLPGLSWQRFCPKKTSTWWIAPSSSQLLPVTAEAGKTTPYTSLVNDQYGYGQLLGVWWVRMQLYLISTWRFDVRF